jgi:hypothetical protein
MPIPTSIYQIKVTLKDFKPPIWRRVLVPDSISLHSLHKILQIVMGWTNSHLHQFIIGEVYYGDPEDDEYDEMENEKRFRLKQFVTRKGFKFIYEYDFGDSWEHIVLMEAILPVEKGKQYPICLDGKRACPPEDIGGVWGYADFLKAFANPKHPDHDDIVEELGEDFDPEFFDLEDVNSILQNYATRARMK